MLGAMVVVSVAAVAWGSRERPHAESAVMKASPPETPWLSKEAAAQIVGAEGALGPLFHDLTLGGMAPSPEARARIADFAARNHVAIDLVVSDDELVAIRFDVSYAGCCGYEGAEVLALRANRPSVGGGCMGGPPRWLNNWAIAHDDGIYMRASVDLNRVVFRWERAWTLDEVLSRADEVLGADTAKVASSAGDRLRLVRGRTMLEVPYRFNEYWAVAEDEQLGLEITEENGRVAELTFAVRAVDGDMVKALRAHWGRPKVEGSLMTWKKRDRIIEVDVSDSSAWGAVTMRRRAG
jgi:hypothetical protein